MNFLIDHEQFKRIVDGTKDIEIRLNDLKRSRLEIGSTIKLTDLNTHNTLNVCVTNLEKFNNFEELFSKYSGLRVGSNSEDSISKMVSDMYYFYNSSDEVKYGVLAIFIKLV